MKTLAAIAALFAATTTTVHADISSADMALADMPDADITSRVDLSPADRGLPRRHKRMAVELSGLAVVGELFYFRGDGRANEHDWQLPWDMRALEAKLTGSGWRFDGNAFKTNAIFHPAFGAAVQIMARRNGYSLGESFLISTGASLVWELALEWAEYASINDILATSTAGVPIGEAIYQMATNLGRTQFEVRGGVGSAQGTTFKTLAARAALDQSPAGSSVSYGGTRTALAIEVPFDDGLRAVEGGAKTSLVGYHRNEENLRLYAGTSAEFGYRKKEARVGSPYDALSTVAVGPTLDVAARVRGVTVNTGVDVYGDFGMVKAWAYDKWKADHQMDVIRNVMRTNETSYYYAAGVSVDPRVDVSYRGFNVGGKVVASLFTSLDGADRDAEKLTTATEQSDRDMTAEAWAGYEMRGVSVVIDGRIRHRDGEMNEVTDGHTERSVMATLGYRL